MAEVYLLSEKRNMAEECSVSNTSIAISSFSSTATTYEQLYDNLCTYRPTCGFTNRLFNGFGQSLCACVSIHSLRYVPGFAREYTYIRSSQTYVCSSCNGSWRHWLYEPIGEASRATCKVFFAAYRSWKIWRN